VPAQAAIVSRAHASVLPSFPKRGPLTLLVTTATALLALAYILARELISGTGRAHASQNEARQRFRRQSGTVPDERIPPVSERPARRAG
ncbi:MAG TPA: hypothetical protein VMW68_07150, partial [Methyloceanibacter sp.]|nr:hypothetical protein [Methyloceanibacter sp.]